MLFLQLSFCSFQYHRVVCHDLTLGALLVGHQDERPRNPACPIIRQQCGGGSLQNVMTTMYLHTEGLVMVLTEELVSGCVPEGAGHRL